MVLVVFTQITLKKVMQILEGSMSFVDRYNLITIFRRATADFLRF